MAKNVICSYITNEGIFLYDQAGKLKCLAKSVTVLRVAEELNDITKQDILLGV